MKSVWKVGKKEDQKSLKKKKNPENIFIADNDNVWAEKECLPYGNTECLREVLNNWSRQI